jgi:hypothetical protein
MNEKTSILQPKGQAFHRGVCVCVCKYTNKEITAITIFAIPNLMYLPTLHKDGEHDYMITKVIQTLNILFFVVIAL